MTTQDDDLPRGASGAGPEGAKAPAPTPPPAGPRRRPGLRWTLALALALPLVVLLALGGTALWLAQSAAGTRALLGWVPGLTVVEPRGALFGDFGARRLELALPREGRLTVDALAWQGLALRFPAGRGPWPPLPRLTLHLDRLAAERVAFRPGRPSGEPAGPPPEDLRLPVGVALAQLRVGELALEGSELAPLRDLGLSLTLADGDGTHELRGLTLRWERFELSGRASLGSAAPMPLQAELALQEQPGAATPAAAPPAASPPSPTPPASAPGAAPASPAPAEAPPPPSALPATPAALVGWTAALSANGPLAAFGAELRLRADGPSVDASATVTPFASLPVSSLQARIERLDLAALHAAAPKSLLSGTIDARLDPAAAGAGSTAGGDSGLPLHLVVDLQNDAAGRWDELRLPLRRLRVDGQGQTTLAAPAELGRFEAELGGPAQPAGRLHGTARWDGRRWRVDAELASLAPAGLDARAPTMVVSGPVTVAGEGSLPFGAAPAAPGNASASQLELQARLTGHWTPGPAPAATTMPRGRAAAARAAPDRPLAATLDLELRPGHYRLRRATLGSSEAAPQLTLGGHAEPRENVAGAGPGWALVGELALKAFDPRPWSKAAADALGERQTQLDGGGRFDLQVPAQAPQGTGLAPWLAAWRGSAELAIDDSSRFAGAPLQARLGLREDAARRRVRAQAELSTQGNRLTLDGELDTADHAGAGDRWLLDADAPALSALAPLLAAAGAAQALEGALKADAQLQGRWPRLAAQGRLDAERLRFGTTTLDAGQASWRLGSSPDDTLALDARFDALGVGGQRIDSVRAKLDGTGRAHRLQLTLDARPPAAASGTATATDGAGTAAPPPADDGRRLVATLEAEGSWLRDEAAGRAGWRGRVSRFDLVPQGGAAAPAGASGGPAAGATAGAGAASPASASPSASASAPASAAAPSPAPPTLPADTAWLRADPFDLEWSSSPQGQAVEVGATRLRVLDAALRFAGAQWSAAPGAEPQMQLDAQLEPLAVAPLLARLQPQLGWGGTLQVAGRVSLHSSAGEGFVADALLERQSGDLTTTDPDLAAVSIPVTASDSSALARTLDLGATQRFGLREARIALSARGGTWRFSQRVSGRSLGEITGEQTVQAARDAIWPADDAALDGTLAIAVESLDAWSGWLPAGWRLAGKLDAHAQLGGRFGAPEYTGRVGGSGLGANNLLLGVDVRDGELAIALEGTRAQIETFTLHGGEGQVRLEGGAAFGEAPQAQLTLVAERFRALARVDRRLLASGRAELLLSPERLRATGSFTADEGLFDISRGDAPSLGDDVQVVGERDVGDDDGSQATAPPPAQRGLELDLRADLGQQLRLRGRGIDTLLRGQVALTSPGGRPALNGVIRTEQGVYAAYAQRLTIDHGTVTFAGPIDNPQLDILALRHRSPTADEDDPQVGVLITGPAQNPRVRLYSDPSMSDNDTLSWLVLGRSSSGLGRTELALVQQAALALLSGEDSGSSDPLARLGIDELSIRQDESSGVRETVVALGKQLSSRWYFGYERSLNATAGTWQLIYRVARRFTVRAQSGLDNSLDLIWSWRWQ